MDKVEQSHVALGVGHDSIVLLDLQQEHIPAIDPGTLVKQLLAGITVQAEAALAGIMAQRLIVIEDKIRVVWPLAIGTTIEIELQDSLERSLVHADLDLFYTIFALDLADVGFRVEVPVAQ